MAAKQESTVEETTTVIETANGDLKKKLVVAAVAFGCAAIAASGAAFARSRRTKVVEKVVHVEEEAPKNAASRNTTPKPKKAE